MKEREREIVQLERERDENGENHAAVTVKLKKGRREKASVEERMRAMDGLEA